MVPYQTKTKKLSGTSYGEVKRHVILIFYKIKKKTKRRPYIRSAYFKKQKIFFDYFWEHLSQKPPMERARRLKYFLCAVEVIENSRNKPLAEVNRNKPKEILYRFGGLAKTGELFYVQIKEDKKTGNKYFMSCFPLD